MNRSFSLLPLAGLLLGAFSLPCPAGAGQALAGTAEILDPAGTNDVPVVRDLLADVFDQEDTAPHEPSLSGPARLYHSLLAGRMEAGVRVLNLNLRKGRRGEPFDNSFIGSIDLLREVQDRRPNRFFLQYLLFPYLGIGHQWHRLEVQTLTSMPREQRSGDRRTDGNVIMRGRLPYLVARIPNRTLCTPFIELGRASYRNEFDPDREWYAGGRRNFILDATSRAYYWGCGVELELTENLRMDAYYRSMELEVPGEYHFRGDGREPEPFVFTMHHACYGIGAKVRF